MTFASVLPSVLIGWFLSKLIESRPSEAPAAPPPPAPTPKPAVTPTAAPAPAAASPKVVPVSHTTAVHVQPPPWPQVVPAGLPAFPGPQWVPDNPPGAGVVARASALLPTLWAHGAGTFKTEQTAGRWITYRATPMGSKHGVVAFKLATEPSIAPKPTPKPTPVVPPPEEGGYVPASAPAPKPAPTQVALKTLRLTSPRMTGPDVVALQNGLGISADGIFGTGTQAAVIAFQRRKGLVPDGIVGPKTWGALFARAA